MKRRSWLSRSCLLKQTECENAPLCLAISPYRFFSYRFRWVFCQLEVLRHRFPSSLRQTLGELPETLDETYARILRDINRANQPHAHRTLECLMVSVRPLRVDELADLLALQFDAAQGGIPKYRSAWRLDDQA